MTRQKLHILVVVAHPHDFTHCAGTCGIHTSMGDTVTVVSMTSGKATPHNETLAAEQAKPPEEQDPAIINKSPMSYAAEKTEELRRAAAPFGVTDVRVLDFPDHPFYLYRHLEAIGQLRDVMLEVRPHVLITQSPYTTRPNLGSHGLSSGNHNDHNDTAYAALQARAQASSPRYGSTKPPHGIAATYYLGVYFEKGQLDFVVDITDWFEQRVEAEAMYVSQGHTEARARRKMEIGLGHTALVSGVRYAEAFVREQPELLPHISLSELTLERAARPFLPAKETV